MGRRSDHSRTELEELIVAAGHRLMEETGFAGFSAREVARRIGYSIGTIYNGMGQFMVIQILCLIVLYIWPGIAMGLVELAR